jgi:hypothetical protein
MKQYYFFHESIFLYNQVISYNNSLWIFKQKPYTHKYKKVIQKSCLWLPVFFHSKQKNLLPTFWTTAICKTIFRTSMKTIPNSKAKSPTWSNSNNSNTCNQSTHLLTSMTSNCHLPHFWTHKSLLSNLNASESELRLLNKPKTNSQKVNFLKLTSKSYQKASSTCNISARPNPKSTTLL